MSDQLMVAKSRLGAAANTSRVVGRRSARYVGRFSVRPISAFVQRDPDRPVWTVAISAPPSLSGDVNDPHIIGWWLLSEKHRVLSEFRGEDDHPRCCLRRSAGYDLQPRRPRVRVGQWRRL